MIEDRAAEIRLLLLDVDGVMTDGHIVLTDGGEEIKSFHVRDGLGLKLLMDAGVDVAIMTGRTSKVVLNRTKEIGIEEVHQGVSDKAALLTSLMRRKGLDRNQICAMGDDLPDLPMLRAAGIAVAVADAAAEVREAAAVVTKNRGGTGAVREICEMILKARGKWEQALSSAGERQNRPLQD